MLIRHSKTSNHFVLPTSLSTSLTMNWSVWHLSMLFLLNTTPSSRPYSFLIRLTSINSSLHSKTKRVNALLEMSLHHPLPLPCPMCSFVRRRGKRCNLTPRDVSSLAILMVLRPGNFGTPLTRRSLSAATQFSMKGASQATLPLLSTSSRLHYLSHLPPLA